MDRRGRGSLFEELRREKRRETRRFDTEYWEEEGRDDLAREEEGKCSFRIPTSSFLSS